MSLLKLSFLCDFDLLSVPDMLKRNVLESIVAPKRKYEVESFSETLQITRHS